MNAPPPIALVVVGGYLGAGKTTMLNRLLADAQGRRIAVLVNDFGEINIDAALIRSRSEDVIQLENGCICCSIGGRLADALLAIAARPKRPDLLVIEASGVSDPQRIAQIGLLDPAFRLNAVIVAVDVAGLSDVLRDPLVGDMARRQIAGASVVALTKSDLADTATRSAAAATVRRLAPRAAVLTARHGDLPLPVYLDVAPPTAQGALLSRAGPRRMGLDPLHGAIRSFCYRTGRAFDKARLRQALKALPVRLLRAKGLVAFEGDPRAHAVHVVAGRMRVEAIEAIEAVETVEAIGAIGAIGAIEAVRHAPRGGSALVFIGPFDAADEPAVRTCLDAALA